LKVKPVFLCAAYLDHELFLQQHLARFVHPPPRRLSTAVRAQIARSWRCTRRYRALHHNFELQLLLVFFTVLPSGVVRNLGREAVCAGEFRPRARKLPNFSAISPFKSSQPDEVTSQTPPLPDAVSAPLAQNDHILCRFDLGPQERSLYPTDVKHARPANSARANGKCHHRRPHRHTASLRFVRGFQLKLNRHAR
jgi:hypothetical protein